MKYIIISFLFIVVNLQFQAQGFSDIIKIEGEYYLIAPSLSIPQDTNYTYSLYEDEYSPRWNRAEYVLINDTINLVNILNEESTYNLAGDSVAPFNSQMISGRYAISKISDIKRTRRELQLADNYEISGARDYTYLEFENGILKKESFVHAASNKDYAYIQVDTYNDVDVNVKFYSLDNDLFYEFNEQFNGSSEPMIVKSGNYKVIISNDLSGNYINKESYFEGGILHYLHTGLGDQGFWEDRDYPDYEYSNNREDQVYINASFGESSLMASSSFNISAYSLGMGYSGLLYTGNRFFHSLNYQIGGSYSYAYIPKQNSLSPQSDIIEQHYSYLTYDIGGSTSIYLSKYKGYDGWRPTLEIGARYSLPIIFRYISRDLTGKYSERWIHKFNDLQVFSKFGFQKGISIIGNYRIFDVVGKHYPQLPRVSLGVSVTFF